MIDRERFAILAGAVGCGEATPLERAEFDAALAVEPALSVEWKQADLVDFELRRNTFATAGEASPLPSRVFARLENARQSALAERLAGEANAAGAANVIAFQPAAVAEPLPSSRRVVPPSWKRGHWLAIAAGFAVLTSLSALWLHRPASRGFQASAVLAPRGVTGITRPTLVWDAKTGQSYDVWILPPTGSHTEAPALFTAKGVQPPLDFSALKPSPQLTAESRPTTRLEPGTDYRLLVCLADAGRVAGVAVPFRTARNSAKALPPASLESARRLAADGRPADALMLLLQLPAAARERAEARALEKELRTELPKLSAPATPAP